MLLSKMDKYTKSFLRQDRRPNSRNILFWPNISAFGRPLLTIPKWVLIVWPKIPPNAQFVCPSPKVLDFRSLWCIVCCCTHSHCYIIILYCSTYYIHHMYTMVCIFLRNIFLQPSNLAFH